MKPLRQMAFAALVWAWAWGMGRADESPPDYVKDIQPLLTRYCAGCHSGEFADGGFDAESFAGLARGTEKGPAFLPGDSTSSRIIRLMTGAAEPAMPPEDEPQPSDAEIARLKAWIDAGGMGPQGEQAQRTQLVVPHVPPQAEHPAPVTAVAISPDGQRRAVARFRSVAVYEGDADQPRWAFDEHPGKVNAVEFSADGRWLLTASGVTGLYGLATLWDLDSGEVVRRFEGHRDVLYGATLTRDGNTLATGSYDHTAILWDVATGEPQHRLAAHNGAIFDVAFSPDGTLLATASADETCKVWHVASGQRFDTLGQPEGEVYSVAFSPDGRFVAAAGADHRIRLWRLESRERRKINPLVMARFAHEGAILRLAYTPDGRGLVSVSDDREAKLWETGSMQMIGHWPGQTDVAEALAIEPNGRGAWLGQLDGVVLRRELPEIRQQATAAQQREVAPRLAAVQGQGLKQQDEQEPNDTPQSAQRLELPASVRGVIHGESDTTDVDLYRVTLGQGEQWVIETNAARSKSPLDSKIEILDDAGQPLVRVLLQATRDSYYTFRGKDSNTSDDFRVHNWQEMELNEYLYSDGEVVRLWLYPRGPDSGFKVYPGEGNRHTFFGTTPTVHALGAPCYIVKPWPPGAEIPPNGLPVFPIYWENDDDSSRELGKDSRLIFTPPHDGDYLVRVSDVRGFQGQDFKYTLTVRPAQPDFRVRLEGFNAEIPRGAGREFRLRAQRIDGYEGPITVDIDKLPAGFSVTSPVIIEAGQLAAWGTITADPDAEMADEEAPDAELIPQARARGQFGDQRLEHAVEGFKALKLADPPQVLATMEPLSGQAPTDGPLVLTLKPGQTVSARVRVDRRDFAGRIEFGNADAGRNLPFGVFVDNIGLNGLLIPEGRHEQEFFITASPIAEPGDRLFHLKLNNVSGGVTTQPAVLRIEP